MKVSKLTFCGLMIGGLLMVCQSLYADNLSTVVYDYNGTKDTWQNHQVGGFWFNLQSNRLSQDGLTVDVTKNYLPSQVSLSSISLYSGYGQKMAANETRTYNYCLVDQSGKVVDFNDSVFTMTQASSQAGYNEITLTFSPTLVIDSNQSYSVMFIHESHIQEFETEYAQGNMNWDYAKYGMKSNNGTGYDENAAPALKCIEYYNGQNPDLQSDKLLGLISCDGTLINGGSLPSPHAPIITKITYQAIPEPASSLLAVVGLSGLLWRRKRI